MVRRLLPVLLAVLLVSIALAVPFQSLVNATASTVGGGSATTITQTGTGLVHYDSLISDMNNCGATDNNTNTINTRYWTIFGDAPGEEATWAACEQSSGLWLGVEANGSAQWAGIYAESPDSNVLLFHTHLVLPSATIANISENSFNTGLYVQTYNGLINYVTCYGQVQEGVGYYWGVGLATGNSSKATEYEQLYTGPVFTNNGPSSEDCTIVTNGSSLLQVYLNGTLVYSNISDSLSMPEPFNAYLEVESSDSIQMLNASYTDYYDTLTNAVTVRDVPAGDTAEIISGSTILASETNSGSSPANVTLDIAQYNMPLPGTLEILSGDASSSSSSSSSFSSSSTSSTFSSSSIISSGCVITSSASSNSSSTSITSSSSSSSSNGAGTIVVATTGSTSFWGGDTYDFAPGTATTSTTPTTTSITPTTTTTCTTTPTTSTTSTTPTTTTTTSTTPTTTTSSSCTSCTLTIDSENTVGNAITGYYTELYTSAGKADGNGYTPHSFTLTSGVGYQIAADSYGVCTFSHWEGGSFSGSTADPAPITITNPTTLEAVYSGSNCGTQTTTTTTSITPTTTTTSTTPTTTTTSTTPTTITKTSTTPITTTTTTSSGSPSVTVESVNQDGQSITGYYTVLYNSAGKQLSTGFTTTTFTGISAGTSYKLQLDSYASCTFENWQSTTNSGELTFTATNGPQTFVGVYDCTSAATPAYHNINSAPILVVALIAFGLATSQVAKTKGKYENRLP